MDYMRRWLGEESWRPECAQMSEVELVLQVGGRVGVLWGRVGGAVHGEVGGWVGPCMGRLVGRWVGGAVHGEVGEVAMVLQAGTWVGVGSVGGWGVGGIMWLGAAGAAERWAGGWLTGRASRQQTGGVAMCARHGRASSVQAWGCCAGAVS